MQNHIFRYQPLHRPHYRRSVAAWESAFWRDRRGASCLEAPTLGTSLLFGCLLPGSGSELTAPPSVVRGTILFHFLKMQKIV